ncbi:hypothetical protein DM860_005021 [Cuscuta australis]|uniref:Protein kinase domain-containing protein n=1 Tax=Cuscuta australis TaxID=267555 RepID=A0A328DM65_9ASTE|nr:hypothetical protein DM860_005021 [Cuscuta australis]
MGFYQTIIGLFFLNLVVLQCVAGDDEKKCNRSCGRGWGKDLPYPFGFSDGCGIRLDCDNGDVKIGEFKVRNLTADSILVGLPASCGRGIEKVLPLNGGNFWMSRRNAFLLENCSRPLPECKALTRLTGLRRCVNRNDSVGCYSELGEKGGSFLSYAGLKSSNCSVVLSSIAAGGNETVQNSAWSLELQTVELVWWLDGSCNCHPDGQCSPVELPTRRKGFRCSCKDGFVGDGFADGDGCRKASSSCNASKYMSGKCGGTRVGILIAGFVSGASLTCIIVLAYYCTRMRSASLKKRVSAKRLSEVAGCCSSVRLYPYKELERATNGFSDAMRLGTGAYGTVYAGKLYNHELVAIKRLRQQDPDGVEQVMNEIKLLSSVSHPNLVRLLGCCLEHEEQILVYEYMPNGTLSQHLQREQRSGLPWIIRLTIAAETARAIAHLHSSMNPPIYHRDIKSSNILLDFNYRSKIADFGLSRFAMTDDSHISTAPQGTPGYLDPQYHQNYHLSDKSDVYSFGVVLVEIITAMKVVDFTRPNTEINLAALAIDRIGKGRVDEIIDPYLEPNRDAWTLSSIHRVAELAFRCLAFHKDMRPSMTEVADELEQMKGGGLEPAASGAENGCAMTTSSSCSSRHNDSERSFCSSSNKRVIVKKERSPVSVREPWSGEQSSPTTDTLLGSNAVGRA